MQCLWKWFITFSFSKSRKYSVINGKRYIFENILFFDNIYEKTFTNYQKIKINIGAEIYFLSWFNIVVRIRISSAISEDMASLSIDCTSISSISLRVFTCCIRKMKTARNTIWIHYDNDIFINRFHTSRSYVSRLHIVFIA